VAAAIGLGQLQRRPEPRRLFRIDDVIGRQLKAFGMTPMIWRAMPLTWIVRPSTSAPSNRVCQS
jgi:hypothetical protein